MAFDAYGSTDLFAVGIFALAIRAGLLLGGFSNFFLRRPFVSDAVFGLVLMVTVAFRGDQFLRQGSARRRPSPPGVDWRLVPAALLILFALWILAALALACSTRLDMIPTLAICSAFFLLGIMSDYLFGRPARRRGCGGHRSLYTVTPNWQLFWLADALETGRATFHWGYVGKAFATWLAYVGRPWRWR